MVVASSNRVGDLEAELQIYPPCCSYSAHPWLVPRGRWDVCAIPSLAYRKDAVILLYERHRSHYSATWLLSRPEQMGAKDQGEMLAACRAAAEQTGKYMVYAMHENFLPAEK